MNVSEWRYYKKCCAQVKKYDGRKYNVGDEVYFRKPDQSGLVTFANVVGEVKQCLPCEYYAIDYKSSAGGPMLVYSIWRNYDKQNID